MVTPVTLATGESGSKADPTPFVPTRARFWFRVQKCGSTGLPCLDKPVFARGKYHGTHVADMTQPYPSKHDNTKHFSSCAQPRYHSVACILIDRHRIEPLASLAPQVEELDMLAFCGWYVTGSLAVNRELFMTTEGKYTLAFGGGGGHTLCAIQSFWTPLLLHWHTERTTRGI